MCNCKFVHIIRERESLGSVSYKKKDVVIYFDSFSDLTSPVDIQKHFKGYNIVFNYTNYQNYNTFVCGHLCLEIVQSI